MISLPPAPTLVVDGLAITRRVRSSWVGPIASPKSMFFRRLGLGTVGRTPVQARLKPEDVPAGLFVTPFLQSGTYFSGRARVPRPVVPLSTSGEVYRAVVTRWLRSHGSSAAARITRALRVDLDGDGRDEILLEASSRGELALTGLNGELARASDYSLVLVRSTGKRGVTERALRWNRGDAAVFDVSLRAIADLDGDGRMEIVLGWTAWEAGGGELWSYRAGSVRKLADNGAGV